MPFPIISHYHCPVLFCFLPLWFLEQFVLFLASFSPSGKGTNGPAFEQFWFRTNFPVNFRQSMSNLFYNLHSCVLIVLGRGSWTWSRAQFIWVQSSRININLIVYIAFKEKFYTSFVVSFIVDITLNVSTLGEFFLREFF